MGPLLVLGGLEFGLRLAGFGYDPGFFKSIRIGNDNFLVENDKFGLRFFPPELARSPAPVKMEARKPPGTCRIFILGESAALGDPRPAYGAGRYLEALLRERFPQTNFEVVCVAMTAINSHAILDIARECARRQGDIWIIYMGNNEMVGPFGAAGVLGAQAPSRAWVRVSLAVQKTRLGQLLAGVARRLRNRSAEPQSWGGMEMFVRNRVAPGNPQKERVYANFRENLRDILETGLSSGAKIVLSTVAVNLLDSPPFASVPSPNTFSNGGNPATADKLFRDGLSMASQTNYSQAAQLFAQAASLDPGRADLEFLEARCLFNLTNFAAARRHFQKACDLDALPFRADSRINALIGDSAHRSAGPGLTFFDAAAVFATNSPTGIPGQESFYEHVHLNFDGNYRLALAWAQQVERFVPAAAMNQSAATWATQETCEKRLGLTDWNRYGVLEEMLRRLAQPPFSAQFNYAERLESFRANLRALRQRMNGTAAAAARKLYQQAIEWSPADYRLHEDFAEFLEATGDLLAATAQWEWVIELIPHHHLAYFQSGRLLLRQAKLTAARGRLLQALVLRPDLSEGWLELGEIEALEGKPEQALADYEKARKLLPQEPRSYLLAGKALSKLQRQPEAIAQFQQAVQLQPSNWEAHYALGEELAFAGRVKESREQFEQVLHLKPDYAMAHLNLGVALAKEGQLDEALRQFEETRKLDPQNKLAPDYIAKIKAIKP